MADQEFFHHITGRYNVAKFRRMLTGKRRRFKMMLLPLGSPLNFLVAVEQGRVDALTPEQRDDPIFAVERPDGSILVIDGYHRIARRRQDGLTMVVTYVMPYRLVSHIWSPVR